MGLYKLVDVRGENSELADCIDMSLQEAVEWLCDGSDVRYPDCTGWDAVRCNCFAHELYPHVDIVPM